MQRKKVWINDGMRAKMIYAGEVIPNGWFLGRCSFSEETKTKISKSRKGKIHVHKGNISKLIIDKDELNLYLAQGFVQGRAPFSAEAKNNIIESRKRFFEKNPHWTNSASYKKGQDAWNKNIPMAESAKEKLSKAKKGTHFDAQTKQHKLEQERITRARHYGSVENSYATANKKKAQTLAKHKENDPDFVKKAQEKRIRTCRERYGVDSTSQVPETQAKRALTNLKKYGVPVATQNDSVKKKIVDSKRENHSFSTSSWENWLYERLLSKFKEEDVIRQYVDNERYPFACDFYIKPLDLFVELNFYWTHGKHRFNKDSEEDNATLAHWRKKQKMRIDSKGKEVKNSFYTAEYVWTVKDPLKVNIAKKNGLNYITIYNKGELYDFVRGLQIKI